LGFICILVAAMAFGSIGPTTTLALRVGVSPLGFTFARAAGGAAILLLFAIAHHEAWRFPRYEHGGLLILISTSALVSLSLNSAFTLMPVALVVGFYYFYPAGVAILASLRHEERLGWAGGVGVLGLLGGIALLSLGQLSSGLMIAPLGIILALVAGAAQTAYVRKGVSVQGGSVFFQAALVLAGTAFIALLVTLIVNGYPSLGTLVRPTALGPLIWAGLVTGALATTLMFIGLRLIGSVIGALAMLAEPVSAAILGLLFLGQALSPLAVIGMLLLLLGAARIATRSTMVSQAILVTELILPQNDSKFYSPEK